MHIQDTLPPKVVRLVSGCGLPGLSRCSKAMQPLAAALEKKAWSQTMQTLSHHEEPRMIPRLANSLAGLVVHLHALHGANVGAFLGLCVRHDDEVEQGKAACVVMVWERKSQHQSNVQGIITLPLKKRPTWQCAARREPRDRHVTGTENGSGASSQGRSLSSHLTSHILPSLSTLCGGKKLAPVRFKSCRKRQLGGARAGSVRSIRVLGTGSECPGPPVTTPRQRPRPSALFMWRCVGMATNDQAPQ